MKFKKSGNRVFIILSLLTLTLMAFLAYNNLKSIKELKAKNAELYSNTTELIKAMHQKAEDLFNPQDSWSWGALSGVEIEDPTAKQLDELTKLKCSDIRIERKTKEQVSKWVSFYKSVGQGFLADGEYIKGFLPMNGYEKALNNTLDEYMRKTLEEQRDIIVCKEAYYVPYCKQDAPNFWISSEFLPNKISANRITYIIRSKYARSSQQKTEYQQGNVPDSELISQDATFILVRKDGEWLIEEFHTSKYAIPEELAKKAKLEVIV